MNFVLVLFFKKKTGGLMAQGGQREGYPSREGGGVAAEPGSDRAEEKRGGESPSPHPSLGPDSLLLGRGRGGGQQ